MFCLFSSLVDNCALICICSLLTFTYLYHHCHQLICNGLITFCLAMHRSLSWENVSWCQRCGFKARLVSAGRAGATLLRSFVV